MMQSAFTKALLNPDIAPPLGLIDPIGRPAPRRFAVYRNNVTLSLIRVLEAGFPATRLLVGDAFFTVMAQEFLRAHPPQTRIMMLYGAQFPNFIAGFAPAKSLGYLPDVAALEQMIRESYHGADSAAIDTRILANMDEAALRALRFDFAPSMRLIRSDWPIFGIWAANMRGGAKPAHRPETVVVMRPNFDPEPFVLPPFADEVLAALMHGAHLDAALAAAQGPFDLAELLTLLLHGGAITGVRS